MELKHEIRLGFAPEEYVNQKTELEGILCQSTFTACGENELVLEIEVNKSDPHLEEETVDLQVFFALEESSEFLKHLQYCYPAREFVLAKENCDFNCIYGYRFPLSFVSAIYKEKGVTLILDDQEHSSVGVQKQEGKFQFTIQYNQVPLQNGKRKIIINFHSPDWHLGFERYKSWYKNKFQEKEQLDERLLGCYHIRRYFFNPQLCKVTIYRNKECHFTNQYQDDQIQAGGVDVALLFDYAYTPQNNIRCGNKAPFTSFPSMEELNRQIQECKQQSNLTVYAYFDPYLIQNGSDFDKAYEAQLPILNSEGQRHHMWSDHQWHPCLSTRQWQEESVRYLQEVSERLAVDGLYLDEMGNGEQFICHNQEHGHEVPLNQNKTEHSYLSLMKRTLPDKLFMCEFFPADRNISLFPSVLSDSRTIVDICRFAFPYKKIFKIINCDRPIGNNTWDVNKVFFNGMGLWLDNDLHSTEFYSPAVKALIKKHYQILKKYSHIFESEEIEPLLDISSDRILVNKFARGNETIYTLINVTAKSEEYYLALEEEYSVTYDIYNDKPSETVVQMGIRSIKIEMNAYSVGCIYIER